MKVKIYDTVYDSEKEPIMVILAAQDKKNIANMLPECTKYCVYPDFIDKKFGKEWIKKWMDNIKNNNMNKSINNKNSIYNRKVKCALKSIEYLIDHNFDFDNSYDVAQQFVSAFENSKKDRFYDSVIILIDKDWQFDTPKSFRQLNKARKIYRKELIKNGLLKIVNIDN